MLTFDREKVLSPAGLVVWWQHLSPSFEVMGSDLIPNSVVEC